MMAIPGLSIPTPQQPILSDISGGIVAQVWWRFFQGLLNRTAATVVYTTDTNVTAAGTTQGDAFALSAEWNVAQTVAVGSGVTLPLLGTGLDNRVWNMGVNSLKIYPPVGCQIDGLGVNAPYVLAVGKSQIFSQLSGAEFRSLQLG